MNFVFSVMLAIMMASTGQAFASSTGAAWGGANSDGLRNCQSCHYDSEAVIASPLLTLSGLPDAVRPGQTYQLTLALARTDAVIAGFMLSASEGVFESAGDGIDVQRQQARSSKPVPAQTGASWVLTWTAPETYTEPIIFHAAVNGANDDASPFGDVIYFKRIEVLVNK